MNLNPGSVPKVMVIKLFPVMIAGDNLMKCPDCEQQKIIKNGKIHNGKQRYKCKNCGRQFVENPPNRRITPETKQIIANCLLEKVSLRGIHRITGVAVSWIQEYSNKIYRDARLIPLSSKKKVRWPSNVMRCGVMSVTEPQRIGYG
jgi:transposase-like protein